MEEMCQANNLMIRPAHACVCVHKRCFQSTNEVLHNMKLHAMRELYNVMLFHFTREILTQHNEADLAPEVLSTTLDFTVVLSRVSQQQVTDQQGGVPTQVLPGKGQTAGLAVCGLVGVHLASKEGNNLDVEKYDKKDIHSPLL